MEMPTPINDSLEKAIENESPLEFIEAMKDASPEQQIALMRQVSMTIMSEKYSSENRIASKINEDHISRYLDASEKNMVKGYQERRDTKIFVGAMVVVGLVAFGIFICLLKDNPQVMEKVLYSVGSLIAGAFGGYGYGKSKSE